MGVLVVPRNRTSCSAIGRDGHTHTQTSKNTPLGHKRFWPIWRLLRRRLPPKRTSDTAQDSASWWHYPVATISCYVVFIGIYFHARNAGTRSVDWCVQKCFCLLANVMGCFVSANRHDSKMTRCKRRKIVDRVKVARGQFFDWIACEGWMDEVLSYRIKVRCGAVHRSTSRVYCVDQKQYIICIREVLVYENNNHRWKHSASSSVSEQRWSAALIAVHYGAI